MNIDDRATVTISEAKEVLRKVAIQEPEISVALWSLPGIGKTAICHQVIEEANRELPEDKRFKGLLDIRLVSHNPVDLAGIPRFVQDGDSEFVRWTPTEMFYNLSKDRYLVLLDELTTAPAASMNAGLEIVWERKSGPIRFRDDTVIVAAANPIESLAAVSRLTAPLANRFALHLTIRPDVDAFAEYALANGLHPSISSYLRFRPEHLLKMPDAKGDIQGWPSPRSWESLSKILLLYGIRPGDKAPLDLVQGAVGNETGREFCAFNSITGLSSWADAIAKQGVSAGVVTSDPGALYALEGVLAPTYTQKLPEKESDHIAEWVLEHLNIALQTLFFRDVTILTKDDGEKRRQVIMSAPFTQWAQEHREALLRFEGSSSK